MKYIAAVLGLLFWFIGTIVLCLTGFGFIFIVISLDQYAEIPKTLLKAFHEEEV